MKPILVRIALALAVCPTLAAAQDSLVSTPRDTREVSLTVYNQNLAVVRERRDLALRPGLNRVRYEDVAQMVEAPTVSIRSVNGGGVSVREQNYQFDLVSPGAILEKSVGRTIRLRRGDQVVEGTLLSAPGSGAGMVLRTADGRLLLSPHGEVEVAEMPPGLASRPSLLWMLDAARGGTQTVEVSYLSGGLAWAADYVAVFDSAEGKVALQGWVTLTNRSGTTYRDAALQLLAGEVRTVTPRSMPLQGRQPLQLEGLVVTGSATGTRFNEEAFFEYHLYTLDGRTTLANNEVKQVSLLTAPHAGVRRRLVFDSQRAWGWNATPGAGYRTEAVKAAIVLELENSRENGMGLPLPAGVVRMYKADARGNLQFLGEDRVDHTPRDETVRLYLGNAFDVVATRKVSGDHQRDAYTRDVTVEVSVRNHKQAPSDVAVVEHLGGGWQIVESTHPHEKKDAGTAEFAFRVPADSETVLRYTVRYVSPRRR